VDKNQKGCATRQSMMQTEISSTTLTITFTSTGGPKDCRQKAARLAHFPGKRGILEETVRRIVIVVAIGILSLNVGAQQTSLSAQDVDRLLVRLHSNDAGDRNAAYERLKARPAALQNPKVKTALLDLLERERLRMIGTPMTGANEDGIGTEGFAEYYSDLSSTVAEIADWDDPHQICILVRGAGTPPSRSAEQAASRELLAWPCLQQMAVSRAPLERIGASRILLELRERAENANDPVFEQNTKQTIVHLLHDQAESVRLETINSLEKFGTEDMIPDLKHVAESDPAISQRTHKYWLREKAAKAIVSVGERSSQGQQPR